MKKIILGTFAISMCFVLTACGNNQENATITSLSNQLDQTANTISNVQTVNPTDIDMQQILESEDDQETRTNFINAQQNLLSEEYYKTDILNKTAKLKNNINKDLKLSKAQTNAIKDLTSNLIKYTNSVAYTKNELSSTVRNISNLKRNYIKNVDKINAKLNRLACNSNARVCYYQNILNTLDQIENYVTGQIVDENVEDITENQQQIKNENDNQDLQSENNTKDSNLENEENNQNKITKNIDTYLPEKDCPNCGEKLNNSENTICPNCNKTVNQEVQPIQNNQINTPINYSTPINRFNNGNSYYGYNSNSINNREFYNMNRLGGGYGNGYNYGINPSRNTDTYAPMNRNIDTYRYGYNGVNNGIPQPISPVNKNVNENNITPEQRLEEYENEDNTIEKDTAEAKSLTKTKVEDIKEYRQINKKQKNSNTNPNEAVASKIKFVNNQNEKISDDKEMSNTNKENIA